MPAALLSGIFLALAFPPTDAKWLIWVALAPLLFICVRAQTAAGAFASGALACVPFALITLHPLVSAAMWGGWSTGSHAVFESRIRQQGLFLHLAWLAVTIVGALFWGISAVVIHKSVRGRVPLALAAPAAWVLVAEWLRSIVVFDYTWDVLGNATADLRIVRALASVGGVWLLSTMVIVVNAALCDAALRAPHWQRRAAVTAVVVGLAGVLGSWLGARPIEGSKLRAAVVQHHKDRYERSDFDELGMDKGYPPLVRVAIEQRARFVVLPESVALGAVLLDNVASTSKPFDFQYPLALWNRELTRSLAHSHAILVGGVDTTERGVDYNSLLAWSESGPKGWYHKRGLVPFAEYEPFSLGSRGVFQYGRGSGAQLIDTSDAKLGAFICQEVTMPGLVRESVRAGATLLVSGGNDGVFANPTVARIHADMAQLRAVETGRYLLRAMKTGVSAIIDPHGEEIVRTESADPAVLLEFVIPSSELTPYVRFGDWVIGVLGLALIVTYLSQRRLAKTCATR